MAGRDYQLDAEMYINEPAVDAGRDYQVSAETYINEPAGGGGGGRTFTGLIGGGVGTGSYVIGA